MFCEFRLRTKETKSVPQPLLYMDNNAEQLNIPQRRSRPQSQGVFQYLTAARSPGDEVEKDPYFLAF